MSFPVYIFSPGGDYKETIYLGVGVSLPPFSVPASEASLSQLVAVEKHRARERINAAYEHHVEVMATGYPESEQKSWYVQIEEAAVVLGDDNQPTPWIDSAASARGVSRQELAGLIQAQNIAYRQLHGTLTGLRQSLRDQIDSLPVDQASLDLLASIDWPGGDA